jgi:hypothetical protein
LQPAQTPSARPRSTGSAHSTRRIASEAGSSSAAPRPATTRPRMSVAGSSASPQARQPAQKMPTPAMKMRRRPNRSPSSPPVSRNSA